MKTPLRSMSASSYNILKLLVPQKKDKRHLKKAKKKKHSQLEWLVLI